LSKNPISWKDLKFELHRKKENNEVEEISKNSDPTIVQKHLFGKLRPTFLGQTITDLLANEGDALVQIFQVNC
jgi:hypothetical protein